MKWQTPIHPSQVTGKQTLTGDKPITRLHKAVNELQQKVAAGVSADIEGVKFTQALIRENTLILKGEVEKRGGSGEDLRDIKARLSDLENKLAGISIDNALGISNGALTLTTTLTLGDGSQIVAPAQSINLTTCGAFTPT